MSKILLFVGILLMAGKASAHYNKSYYGYTFILPDPVMDRSNTKPMQLSFSDAQRWCAKNVVGSTLATIPDRYVQQNITEFIYSALQSRKLPINGNDNIRLNGRFNITNEWRWVNGRPKTAEFKVDERIGNSGYSFYTRLVGTSFNIYADNGRSSCYTICEYPGNSERCDLFLNGRCYQKRNWRYWHDARNECLDGGGDLASFETLNDTNIKVSLQNLSLYSTTYYCIGLQKNEWRWEDTDSAIKYTNWSVYRAFDYNLRCLCLAQYKWEWTECDCSKQYPFICMLKDMPDSSTQVTEETSTSTESIQFVILGVSCAVVFVVVIIIVAALIIKKRRNSDAQRALRSSGYVTPKRAVTESSTDFPVYEEIIQNPK